MIILELTIFAVAMTATWKVRRWQLRSLQTQERFLKAFAEGVAGWRASDGVPDDAKEIIDRLVQIPFTKWTIRRFTWHLLTANLPTGESSLLKIRDQLSPEQRESFDWLLITYFLGSTYGDWLTGWFLRRVRIGGLSNQTRAEVAIDTIFSREMSHAAYA